MFLLHIQVEDYQSILRLKVLTTCFYLIKSIFKKTRRILELVSPLHFLHNFWRKIIWKLIKDYTIILKLRCCPIVQFPNIYMIYIKLFQKTERGLKLDSMLHFCTCLKKSIILCIIKSIFRSFILNYSTLYSVNWSNFIVSLPLLLEISGNIWITIICYPVDDVIILKLTFTFLSSRFLTWPKTSGQIFKYLKNKKSF